MTTPTDADIDDLPETELLALPGEAIPAGRLTAFFTRRAEVLRLHDLDVMMLERSGNSNRHFLTFADTDPRLRQRREEDDRRRAWLAEKELLECQRRSDRLLSQIEEQMRVVDKRRREIEDNAIRLRDGRRVYVDGDRYRDEEGRVLTGVDEAEAESEHRRHPSASTWDQKREVERQAEDLRRQKERILTDQSEGLSPEERTRRLEGYEKEFAQQVAARQSEIKSQAAPVDYGSADIAGLWGEDYQISTKPAFTAAVIVPSDETKRSTETETGSATAENRKTTPSGQGGPKLG